MKKPVKKWVTDAEYKEDGERLRDNLEAIFKPQLLKGRSVVCGGGWVGVIL